MNRSITSKALVVSNFAFDNSTDLFKLLKTMKNDFKTLPSYIDYVTYKDTDFLKFITAKYTQGYRIIIGGFYSSQCLSVFDFLNNHDDLLLISSSSTAIFPKQMPTNLIRLASNDEKGFSLFKNNVLNSMNKVLLMMDSTLSNFPRQKKLINLNEKTFVKTVNVLYTDEDIYNLSYVRMIKRSITGNEPYKFKFFKIDSATIAQNKLTPIISTILKTNDASNVFMILTISYAQQFLNILSSNFEYGIQMIFFSDTFSSHNLTVKTQLPYSYTLINDIVPTNIDYYQRILFNNAGYINYYTISILRFLKTHCELINNNILNGLSTKNMIDILKNCNEIVNGQPKNDKISMIRINFEYLTTSTKKYSDPLKTQIQLVNASFNGQSSVTSTRNKPIDTTTTSGSTTTDTNTSISDLLSTADLITYKSLISGLYYIKNNKDKFDKKTDGTIDNSTYYGEILELLQFLGNPDVDTFINATYTLDTLNTYIGNFLYYLNKYNTNPTYKYQDETIIDVTINSKIYNKLNFFYKFVSFIILTVQQRITNKNMSTNTSMYK